MDKTINPYDLGENNLVEETETIKIQDFIRKAQNNLKTTLIQSQINALGIEVKLISSKTRFNGERLWFVCPTCHKRVGCLYKGFQLGCRECLGLKYRKQRFKRMVETTI